MKNIEISVVIPCYKCSQSLEELYSRLIFSLSNIVGENFEIILVNDASPENDWEIINKLFEHDKKVIGVNLSKNFGEYFAITAGLDIAQGKWIVVMDGDLQDQPEEILKLYDEAQKGFDIVFARRDNRQDKFLKKLSSKAFYAVFSFLSDTKQEPSINNFGIYHRKTIEIIKNMRERTRFLPVLIKWIGFKTSEVKVEHAHRKFGETSYSISKLFQLAFDTILAFSDKPLKLTIKLGFIIVILSVCFAIEAIIEGLIGTSSGIKGWPSIMFSLWFLSGLIIMTLGVMGIYVGKIFDETKNRPLYLIQEVLKKDKKD